jgi:PAS domain S-box-containing protein
VVEANQSFADMLGYTRDEILRLRVWDWDALYPSEEQFDAQWPQTPSIAGVIETQHRRKDGSIYDVEIRSNPAEWEGHYQLYCVCRDITERKRAEAEKEKLQAQLVQAQKMESVGRLAGGVAHDFNNALQSILGYAELALDTVQDGDPLQTDLREIRKAAERSAALTRQLLAFARKQTVAPRVLDLNETVSGMIRMLERLIGEDIDLVWIPGPGSHPTRIDPSQVDQVLANLAINARDAIAGSGRTTIETGIALFDEAYCASHPDCLPGEYVMLAVSDTGCGMDKEILANVFDPFFTTKEMGKGTGLGLATVYGIVRQNNGLINVYSEVNRGTTFRIYLQRHHTESHEDSGVNSASSYPAGELAGAETVLVVEDEETILNLAKRILEGLGYRVLAVPKPSDALQIVRASSVKVDLLITDVVMPEMDGRNLANQLEAIVPRLKSLFMSGYTANVIAHHGVLDEGVHFLQKPFSAQELAERVRNALDS